MLLIDKLQKYKVLLASKSPRRHHLLQEAGIQFELVTDREVAEDFHPDMEAKEVPVYLSKVKSEAYSDLLEHHTILITADTIVCQDGNIIGKPENKQEAYAFIESLSNAEHTVYTGVTLANLHYAHSFCSETKVFFDALEPEEIAYYLNTYKPYDKAGAYGIQEWIGYIGISKIEGSFFNVMGLPIHQVYIELKKMVYELEKHK